LIIATGKLHNNCIKECISSNGFHSIIRQHTNLAFTQHEVMLQDTAAYAEFEVLQLHYKNAWSNNRDLMVQEIDLLKLTCPGRQN
jgi:hypothetical protein